MKVGHGLIPCPVGKDILFVYPLIEQDWVL
jgi:hypothetical protein